MRIKPGTYLDERGEEKTLVIRHPHTLQPIVDAIAVTDSDPHLGFFLRRLACGDMVLVDEPATAPKAALPAVAAPAQPPVTKGE